jgi:type II secretory pathway component PulF
MSSWFPTFGALVGNSRSFRAWWPWYSTTAQRQSLLRLIAVATEEHLPLAPLLENWMDDERGMQRRRLRKLVRLLGQGRSLTESLELVPGVLRDEDLLAIRFDAQTGTRTAAMREVLAKDRDPSSRTTPRLERAVVYFCVLFPLSLLVVAFTQVRIVPVLGKIFQEFGAELPGALAWSMASRGTAVIYVWLAVMALVPLLWWLLATRSGRPVRSALFGRLFQPWHEWRAAGVLQNIAIAAGAGRPIPGALSTLARYHFDPTIRRELLFVRNEVEQGADVWQSMSGVGLITLPESQLLKSAEASGDLAWVLRKVVDAKERRTSRRLEWIAELAMPLLVVVMASLVLFQALTVFQPLARIIHHLL